MSMFPVKCMDCKADYEKDIPLDCILAKEQWLLIHPQDGGVLCASCIVKRAAKLPHVVNLTASITFAGQYINLPPLEALKRANERVLQLQDHVLSLQSRILSLTRAK